MAFSIACTWVASSPSSLPAAIVSLTLFFVGRLLRALLHGDEERVRRVLGDERDRDLVAGAAGAAARGVAAAAAASARGQGHGQGQGAGGQGDGAPGPTGELGDHETTFPRGGVADNVVGTMGQCRAGVNEMFAKSCGCYVGHRCRARRHGRCRRGSLPGHVRPPGQNGPSRTRCRDGPSTRPGAARVARRTRKDPSPSEGGDYIEHIVDIDVGDEMQGSFLEYAYSVIYSRALPDARDGLKPVQRRILYTMNEMGLRPDRGHVKSARVVGEVMGRLHPHGDGAIYDALVRMAQPWSMRLPLVDGHGNFGSLGRRPARRDALHRVPDGAAGGGDDRRASTRTPSTSSPTTTAASSSPSCCRRRSPTCWSTARAGIAVGMATNMAPHNLVEVVAGAAPPDHAPRRDARRPDALRPRARPADRRQDRRPRRHPRRLRDRPRHLPDARHRAGRERHAAPQGHRRHRAALRRRAREGHRADQDAGPAARSCRASPTSRTSPTGEKGLRLVIEVKNGFDPEAILEQLYRLTPMEDSFGINAVALVDGQPRTLGLKELLEVFLGHRFDVVRRRSPVPPRQGGRPAAPGRGPADRDPRHRRGHPADPHQRRRRGRHASG